MHRRSLRVLGPCDVFEPRQRESFCAQCRKRVYDVSRMTEKEARAFLRSRAGTTVCVAYWYGADGRISFRPAPTLAGWLGLAVLLSACAGYVDAEEIHLPGDVCFDAEGHEVACTDPAAGYQHQPDAVQSQEPEDGVFDEEPREIIGELESGITSCPGPKAPEVVEQDPVRDEDGGVHLRVNFDIDPQRTRLVGILVLDEDPVDRSGPYGRLKFRPTRELWSELGDRLRALGAARKARRGRR